MPLLIIHIDDIGGNCEKAESVFNLLLLGETVVSLIVDLKVLVFSHHGGIDDLYRLEKVG